MWNLVHGQTSRVDIIGSLAAIRKSNAAEQELRCFIFWELSVSRRAESTLSVVFVFGLFDSSISARTVPAMPMPQMFSPLLSVAHRCRSPLDAEHHSLVSKGAHRALSTSTMAHGSDKHTGPKTGRRGAVQGVLMFIDTVVSKLSEATT